MTHETRRVLPKNPVVPTHTDVGTLEKPRVSLLLLLFGFCFAGLFLTGMIASLMRLSVSQTKSLMVGLEVVAVGLSFVVYLGRKSHAEVIYQDRIDQALGSLKVKRFEESIREAQALTEKVTNLERAYRETLRGLDTTLDQASNFLRNAAAEFEEEAYAPFWDNIEGAAVALARFNRLVVRLSQITREYDVSLAGRVHNFSALARIAEVVPDPSTALRELARLVRLGQRNFQFATIWEHRRTREVLIEGFETLGDAVNNLGYSIDSSLSDLRTGLSSGFNSTLHEQKLMRESFEEAARKWDEIQGAGA